MYSMPYDDSAKEKNELGKEDQGCGWGQDCNFKQSGQGKYH